MTPTILASEAEHRAPAIVEQVIADLKDGPPAHLLGGKFTANAAWLVLAAIAHNLLRAAGAGAGSLHIKTTTATLRARPVAVPARIARIDDPRPSTGSTGGRGRLNRPAQRKWGPHRG